MKFLATPVDVGPATADSWQTVDLSTHFGADAGSVAAAVIRYRNDTSSTVLFPGIRTPGDVDEYIWSPAANDHFDMICAVNASDEIQIYRDGDERFFLVGYFLNSDSTFNSTWGTDVTPATKNSWVDLDLSASVGANQCAVLLFRNTAATTLSFGVRANGDTDATTISLKDYNARTACVPVDGSSICEVYCNESIAVSLVGYTTANFTALAAAGVDITPSTAASYEAQDLSASLPTNAIGISYLISTKSTSIGAWVREPSLTGFTASSALGDGTFGVSGVNASREVATYFSSLNASTKIKATGYFTGGSAAPTISSVTPSTIAAGSNPVITGANFEATQGTGTVKLSPTDNVADANAVTQTIAASGWSDTEITLDGVSFPTGTSHNDTLYLFVTNDTGDSNAAGEAVTAYIAPTLTSPTAVSIGTTTVTPRVTTDTGNGTCYYVITPQAESEPTNTQVEAGQNATGGAPVASGSQVVSSAGVVTFSEVTGLTAGTAYRISYAHSGTPS